MDTHFDRSKTLQELEGCDWGEPKWHSGLVLACHRLRRKPLNQFTIEDLRIMIGQQIGLPFLIPIAVERLEAEPLAEGDHYRGDLLNSVLNADNSIWTDYQAHFRRTCEVARRAKALLPTLDNDDRATVQEVLRNASSVFRELLS